jgi:Zn-dependent alcohol dehydrogenase
MTWERSVIKVTPDAPIELLGPLAARESGCTRLVAIDRLPARLSLATDFGATDTVGATSTDPVDALRELTVGSRQRGDGGLGARRGHQAGVAHAGVGTSRHRGARI